jgi:hypothetical protein
LNGNPLIPFLKDSLFSSLFRCNAHFLSKAHSQSQTKMLFAKVVISANRRKYAALCAHQRSQGLDKRARALGLFKFQSFDLLFTLSSRTRAKFSLKESFQSTQRRNHVRCFMLACTVRLHAAGVKNSIAARALHLILQWMRMRGARQHQQLTHCQTCKLFRD